MNADYITNPLYENNPFIEALPPMLAGKDLIRALASIPPYSDNDRDRSTGERLQLLSSLYEYYQPLSMTIDLYCEVYTALQHCYGQYSMQRDAAALQNDYAGTVTKEANCTDKGETTYSCTVCGATKVEEDIAALGHDFHGGNCNRCGVSEDYDPEHFRQTIFTQTNEFRAENNRAPLTYLSQYQTVADLRAKEQATSYGHESICTAP